MFFLPTAFAAEAESAESAATLSNLPDILLKVLLGVGILVGVFLLATLIAGLVKNAIQKRQGDKNKGVIALYGRIVFFGVFALGAMIGLTVIGVPLGWFSGGVGLGLAFAMRSFITNFFAGIMLLTNDRFNIGDFIIAGSIKGKIMEIRGRHTTLRAVDGGEITIPNIKLLNTKVTCYARNPTRRHELLMDVGYDTDLKEAARILKRVTAAHKNVEATPKPMVLIGEVADSSVVLKVKFWTKVHSKWWITKSDLTRKMFDAINDAGIDIPYPIQTLRVDEASSGLLASKPDFLGKLKKIEKKKQILTTTKAEVFQPTPVETTQTPAAAQPAIQAESTLAEAIKTPTPTI
jgi:small conductance mechanosensitive channel